VTGFAERNPDGVLVNAAAYTDVERAENDRETSFLVNDEGARNLAEAAVSRGIRLAHVSTDFVFDGEKSGPYVEGDEVHPLSAYGESKLAGERSVAAASPDSLIVRTAWVFGAGGMTFPHKMLELATERENLTVVTDQVGSPTYTVDLAAGILALLDAGATGLFHLVGAGSCSWYELAAETLRLAGVEKEIRPTTADAFPSTATRPHNSVLDCSKAAGYGVVMPEWRDALSRFVAEAV
jgi:dTDP-4-dehydrorhamnose reductase